MLRTFIILISLSLLTSCFGTFSWGSGKFVQGEKPMCTEPYIQPEFDFIITEIIIPDTDTNEQVAQRLARQIFEDRKRYREVIEKHQSAYRKYLRKCLGIVE